MLILGVDPGLASTGVVVIETDERLRILHKEVIRTKPGQSGPARLGIIADGVRRVIDDFAPAIMGIESAFVRRDAPQAGLSLGKVLGAIMLTAYQSRLDIVEITPRDAKRTLTGYGNATKGQIERAVSVKLEIDEPLRPSHVADAAAIALTAASIVATLGKK
jgi:crossover junction endodeoxyribonuclease RuvC